MASRSQIFPAVTTDLLARPKLCSKYMDVVSGLVTGYPEKVSRCLGCNVCIPLLQSSATGCPLQVSQMDYGLFKMIVASLVFGFQVQCTTSTVCEGTVCEG